MDMCTHPASVYPEGPRSRNELSQWTALVLGAFVLLTGSALTTGSGSGTMSALFSYGAMLAQLYAPLARADRLHQPTHALKLHGRRLRAQLGAIVVLGGLLLPPWAAATYLEAPM